MSDRHQKAWQLLKQPTSVYGGAGWSFGSPSVLSLYYRESGRLEEHIRDLKEAASHYTRVTGGHGSGAEYAMEAECYFNQGDFENAAIAAQKALLKALAGKDKDIVYSAEYFQILIAFMQGDLSRVIRLMQKMHEAMTGEKEDYFIHPVEICEGCIYAYLDQADRIPARLQEADLSNPRLRFPAFPFFIVMYGRILLIRGEYLKLIGSAEHFGPATEAMLYCPHGVAVTNDGSIFSTDTNNHRLRKVNPDGVINTVAGTGLATEEEGFSGDGGPAVEALLFAPIGVAVSSGGQIYFADAFNHRIRKLEFFPLAIETTVLPRGVIGNPYHAQLEAAGGAAPYTWSVTGLPAGLHCSSSGVISGTPEQPGSFQFMSEYTVQVAVEDAAGALDSKTLSLKVYVGTGNGSYIVTPIVDPTYTGGLTADGIVTLTVNSGVSGFRYFNVSVNPVTGHDGNEVLVFVHRRGGKQMGISTVKTDFDVADFSAGASFNVRPGNVIKVYLVDDLTNDPGVNPVVL